MASLRDVQNQITGVKKTKQITKAMNMVASAKLRNAQERIERFRPYADKFYEMLGDLAAGADESVHPLLEVRDEVKTVAIMVTTSDRGLCGAFNINIINKAKKLAQEKAAEGKTVKMYCIGKKARDAFKKLDFEIVRADADSMSGKFDFTLAASVGNELISGYMNGELDEVHVVYGEFQSMAKQPPVALTVLPMAAQEEGESQGESGTGDYLYEPSVEGLLAELLPRFIKVQVYRGLLDTSASEHAARMAAMDNATKACDELTDSLTLLFNKTRQAAITGDLMDIVGGVEALKG
ncbi:ATP synthase gamma chain [Pseudodesulfovibrio profundus]|uniref:ATP synthase gamma chain n=1 Tax=Pseudodesulfovibrio profundus TaxID=57320 RepID=A0A2C8F8I1_9BACT|nr:F0F1 ATP synthase subunit gamma [Pseudodesulfovibrio profundus]MBC17839.1 ATP synthase F1 subunit gamma [Desulfovibrio sp.]SOB58457.1 ATP synthase gamma chain [Pseudodesulfovibrio profundus]|tara:strand:+ start:22096 stop:22977 length:882 start_codon:yes stop_codon:yes gene_type:complete